MFVLDPNILSKLDKLNRRVTFILRSLAELDEKLRRHGSKLVVLYGDPVDEIPKFAESINASAVYTGLDHEPYALARDAQVANILRKPSIAFHTVSDQTIFHKGQVLSKTGTPFRVFTPFSRQWLELFVAERDAAEASVDNDKFMPANNIESFGIKASHDAIGFQEADCWVDAGEDAARKLLKSFEERIDYYGERRDFPSVKGVSYMSVHLRFGTISIRDCVRTALRHESAGAKKWLMELIWREFYQDILANNPEVTSTTFDPQYRDLVWPGSDEHFQAWCQGQTGYPIVDAAMRCFNATGWMHNRLRMIVASFLTKDLLVDYKKGEAYFATGLLDFDLASNNGGWQWAASVGCDAQPYFRIFNPYLQSRKFDPDGTFIRRWIPELNELSENDIHCPTPFQILETGYLNPIVDHDTQRKLAVTMFEECRERYAAFGSQS